MQPSLSENQINLSRSIDPENLIIPLDPNLIEQVLINLIKNSIEALEETENPQINLQAAGSGNRPVISITDNGPGIEPTLLQEVFVPFYSTKEKGSGIGLSLSRQIMRLHGGSINVISSPEFSTTFSLRFK